MFTLFGVALLWSLCGWQLGRRAEAAEERLTYEERLLLPAFNAEQPPDDPALRRVFVSGRPDWDNVQRVLGKYMWSQQGVQLLVPVRAGEGLVLVDIGWVPEDEADAILVRERGAGSLRTYAGIARPFGEPPDAMVRPGYWRAVAPLAMGQALGTTIPSWVLIDGEGLPSEAPISDRVPPISGWRTAPSQRPHTEYAFTWFSLGSILVAVWLSMSFSRLSTGP